jgi:hypothetical protein
MGFPASRAYSLGRFFSGVVLQRSGKVQTAMIRPGAVGRQVAAAMGCAELEARKAIEGPLENQMGEGNRGFVRIADDVAQKAVALEPFLEVRDALGMEEHQHAKFLGLRPKGVKLGIRQFLAVDTSPNGDTAEPQARDAVYSLLGR